ncbi:3-hydroxyacyl-CoA dehydrogenase [Aquincola sp. S2]|uniref:3-hydroxyacyl-CoA dehydrogenase n=1 Tax=Pseudaquabacterium terrae TaxID=2732868 RepID=A0ABX2EP26_9BURK|nr:3-hydroxyacyl-CoA dehydrogenase [Aquabacterium terrae]NRF70401.1 3-hydroxyacyl-CoA dehydrogenase [Aquabacterium terrae]
MSTLSLDTPLLVIGAGIMGAGIAQVAAQAGHPVWLYDLREGAAAQALDKLAGGLQALEAKGKLAAGQAQAIAARIRVAGTLEDAAGAGLVVEAIVENVGAKRSLFAQLEGLLSPDAILATNTSSISITAIAQGLKRPRQVVGMHFFNPVPLMKLVEVVSGLETAPAVAEAIHALASAWGKTAVHARSTPGFIVNRIARPYYAETWALLQEQAATPAAIDAALRGAGFRMGPCELMDLIGHDTNLAVTESVYQANYGDKRFQPSLLQRELVDGGLLGRKSGRGFYDHAAGAATPVLNAAPTAPVTGPVEVHGGCAFAQRLADGLRAAGITVEQDIGAPTVGLRWATGRLEVTDGRPALQRAAEAGVADSAVFDWVVADPAAGVRGALAFAVAPSASDSFAAQAAGLLAALGWQPLRVADAPGLIVARTIAMLINEAADAVQQAVCAPDAADAAMKLGVGYPAGPFEWLQRVGVGPVVELLDRLDQHYRGERYRVSPWLRRAHWQARAPQSPARHAG